MKKPQTVERPQTFFVMVQEADGRRYTYEVLEPVPGHLARVLRVIGPRPHWQQVPGRKAFCDAVHVRALRMTSAQEACGQYDIISFTEALRAFPDPAIHLLVETRDALTVHEVLGMRLREKGEKDAPLPGHVPTRRPPDAVLDTAAEEEPVVIPRSAAVPTFPFSSDEPSYVPGPQHAPTDRAPRSNESGFTVSAKKRRRS